MPPHDDDCSCLQCFQALQRSLSSALKLIDDMPDWVFAEMRRHPRWGEIHPLLGASHRFRPCTVGAMYCHHPGCGKARWEHAGEGPEELLGACPHCGKQHSITETCGLLVGDRIVPRT